MLPVLSREQMRQFDRNASDTWHVPAAVLMENAGRGASEAIAATLPKDAKIVVVTGVGNNAGDGFVVARRLLVLGYDVVVLALCLQEALVGDARNNCDAFVALGGQLLDCSTEAALTEHFEHAARNARCVVDAIFGTGLSRPIEGVFAQAIVVMNRTRDRGPSRPQLISLDIPSGLEADCGRVLGVAVRADTTLTFAHHKLGLHTPQGVDHCGEIRVIDIGVPSRMESDDGCAAWLLEPSDISALLSARRFSSHKNSAGRVVVFAGSPGKVGAALLVGKAALRAGAGVVTLAGFDEVAALLDRQVEELMTGRIDRLQIEQSIATLCVGADAVVVGPGLGLDDAARSLVRAVVLGFKGPVVMDADALTHFAGQLTQLASAPGSLILTPHPGEMGRLLGLPGAQVEDNRWQAARNASDQANATVVLKGACTIVSAPGERTVINRAHAPALATAGSGDVLAGVVAALCLTLPPTEAAAVGVFLHARAAEAWQRENHDADRGLLAHEVADRVPSVIAELLPRL